MGVNWPFFPLEELVEEIFDRRGVTPTKLGSAFTPTGHRVISAKLIKDCRIDFAADEPRFVDDATYHRWMNSPLLPGDVIMTSEAPLGELAYISEPLEWCLGQRLFGIRAYKARLHGRFLYYALQSEDVVHDIHSRATGTTVLGVRQTELRRVRIPVPPLQIQISIAHILGTLDDKIELNRRTNETLEAMARALFKSWFVDFDPVRAKAAGRKPVGMDEATAALFPDAFEPSELGEIPRGWRILSLEAVTTEGKGEIKTGPFGSQLHASDYSSEGVPVVMPTNIWNRRIDSSNVMRVSPEHVKRLEVHKLQDGDIVYSRRGDVEKHALISTREQGWLCGTGCLRVRPGKHGVRPLYLSQWLDLPESRAWIAARAVGATMPNLNTQILGSLRLVCAPSTVQLAFEKVASVLDARIRANLAQNETLTMLRDALLPRLLSGEISTAQLRVLSSWRANRTVQSEVDL